MEITKEYLDKQFKNSLKLTKEYLDEKLDKFELKIDQKLSTQTKELKGYVRESFETQQVYLDERFKELTAGMEVKVNFPTLKAR